MKYKRFGIITLSLNFLLISVFFFVNSCKHEGIPADQMNQVNFTEQVLPIFKNSCGTSGCHASGHGESGYVFTDYTSIMKAVTPGNAKGSKAYQAITSAVQLMPPNNALTSNQRTIIRLWIDQGAKN